MTPSKARWTDSRLTAIFRTVWLLAASVYCLSVTGTAPKYPEIWRYSLARSLPRSVSAKVYAGRKSPPFFTSASRSFFRNSIASFATLTGRASCSEMDDSDNTPPKYSVLQASSTINARESPVSSTVSGGAGTTGMRVPGGVAVQGVLLSATFWSACRVPGEISRWKTGCAMSSRNRS